MMKKIILSLVAVTLSVFFVGLASATGDGIHNGTSFKFPNSSGFKSEGSFWGGSTGDANASGVGNDLESKTFSTGTSEGNFGSTFDGKKLKMLKRHLMTHYQMTPEQYRAKWNLPVDYPMVAPNYAEQRRTLAKKIGLGTKRRKSR